MRHMRQRRGILDICEIHMEIQRQRSSAVRPVLSSPCTYVSGNYRSGNYRREIIPVITTDP